MSCALHGGDKELVARRRLSGNAEGYCLGVDAHYRPLGKWLSLLRARLGCI